MMFLQLGQLGLPVVNGTCDSSKTMVHPKGIRAALRAVEQVDQMNVTGDIVEVGVWLGGMSCMMALQHWRSYIEHSHTTVYVREAQRAEPAAETQRVAL